MNKKGQVFLIAAIIFIFAIYSVVIHYNTAKEYAGLEDYQDLTENYQNEFPKVANKAIYNNEDPNEELKKFNDKFLKQAKNKDPNFGTLYAYKDAQGNLHLVNTLTNKVITIELKDESRNKKVTASLASGDIESTGCVSIDSAGLGCSSTPTAEIIEFGDKYRNTYDFNGDASTLLVHIPVGNRIQTIEIDIKEFTTMTYITSQESIALKTPTGEDLDTNKISATLSMA